MLLPPNRTFVAHLRTLSNRFDIAVLCIGVLVFIGWGFNLQVLKSIASSWPAMRPITAICFILSACTSITSKPDSNLLFKSRTLQTGYIFAWIVLLAAIFEIIHFYAKGSSELSNMLLYGWWQNPYLQPKQLSLTAFCFLFLSLTFIANWHGASYSRLQVGLLFVSFPAFVEMLDYMFWAKDVYLFGLEKMALHTAVCFSLLSLSILFARPQMGWMAVVSSDSLGGTIIRRLLLRILMLLLILSEVRYMAQRFRIIDVETGIVFTTILAITLISFAMIRIARDLGAEDIRRRLAEQKLEHLNQSLIRRTKQLELSNAELELMINVASHDLTEPVKTISNYSDLVLKKYGGKFDDNAAVYFNFLRDATRRMRVVIRDVLAYGNVGKNNTFEECDGNRLLEEVMSNLAEPISLTGSQINIAILPAFRCNKDIKLVFLHIIANAIKFRRAGIQPVINISCEPKGDKWLFKIEDNGIGIEKQYFDRIFRPFQRLYPKHKYEGSGIGLAICKKVIELQDGQIWVESAPNHGSTFYFTVPKITNHGKEA